MGCGHPEWLPEDWKVRVKVRSCGKKDKYYVNPSNGLKFNSKPEVLRYLKSSEPDNKPNHLDKMADPQYLTFKNKESRTTEKGGRVTRDPLCLKAKGQRSINEKVDQSLTSHQSIKSGLKLTTELKCATTNDLVMAAGNCLEQREDNDSQDAKLFDKPLPTIRKNQQTNIRRETRNSAKNKVHNNADGDQLLKSGSKGASPQKADAPEAMSDAEHKHEENDSVTSNVPNKLPQVSKKKQHEVGRRHSKRLAENKKDNADKYQSLQSGSEGAEEKNIIVPEVSGSRDDEKQNNSTGGGHNGNLTVQNKKTNSKRKWASELPRRTSKRLAGLEVDALLEVKKSKKATPDANGSSSQTEVKTIKDLCKSSVSSNELEIDSKGKSAGFNNSNKHHRTEDPLNSNLKNPGNHGNLSSHEEHKGVGIEMDKNEKHLDSALNDLLMDPCIEFAIKTLTGAIPLEEMTKVDSSSPRSSLASLNQASASSTAPSVNIWADPCFEFAVKTLTSDMPLENGSSQFQVTVQQPLSSSGSNSLTLPKFRLDNLYPSNYSFSQSDAVKK